MTPAVVTVTSTVPAVWAGVTAVSWVGESTTKLVAAVVPKSTAVAPLRFVPTTSTVSPPAVEPIEASTAVTVGGMEAEAGEESTATPAIPATTATANLETRDRHEFARRPASAGEGELPIRAFRL